MGVFLIVGCIERAGGSLYCAAVYVCPKLGMIGKRRKVMPTGSERLVWAQGSPATLRAVSTTIRGVRINMAAAICWESYMPLLRQALYAQNINLYLAPTADDRDAWLSLMRTIGAEGRCFVVSANMCVRQRPSSSGSGGGSVQQQQQISASQERDGSVGGALASEPAGSDAGTSWMSAGPVALGGEYDVESADPPPISSRRRRTSVITEDGHEIVLPCLDKPGSVSPKATARTGGARRRRSIFDEYGNEIVLCSKLDHDDGDDMDSGDLGSNAAAVSHDTRGKLHQTATYSVRTTTQGNKKIYSSGGGQFISRGGSCITGPYGDVLAEPQWEDDSTINIADVDFEDCIRGRLDLDAAGSYSRNDSFKFSVEGLDLSPLPYY
ncbi:nitrilase 2 [Magnaporthiopsis poae ATCC 64411]|uniref:Nitrilase 2 n=1 Tax=Magnaporthiopsis poae (strain ATCC 64411 / 73-15) TaxID=644358 RepID=A0A0C4DXA0_MAGP6|nr:nitrilase 2 [Magnaporthiopsis poae ATCC 64411]